MNRIARLIVLLIPLVLTGCSSLLRPDEDIPVSARRLTTPTAADQTAPLVLPTRAPPPTVPPAALADVVQDGNLRSEPRIADDTVVAQVCPGDVLQLLEEFTRDDVQWLRVTVQQQGATACSPNRAAVESTGWVSGLVVQRRGVAAEPTPLPPGALELSSTPTATLAATLPTLAATPAGTRPIQELARWQDEQGITGIVLSPDGSQLAGSFVNGTMQLWNATNGRLNQTLLVTRTGTPSALLQTVGIPLAYSPDGRLLAAGFTLKAVVDSKKVTDATEPGEIWLWDLPNGVLRTIIPVASAALAFSPDTRYLAVAGVPTTTLDVAPTNQPINLLGRAVQLWDISSERTLRRTMAISGTALPRTLLFSPDGQHLLAVMRDGTLEGWQVETAASLPLLPTSDALHIAYDPQGRLLLARLSRSETRLAPPGSGGVATVNAVQVQVQNVLDGSVVQTFDLELAGLFRDARFSPDGTLLVIQADRALQVWDVQSGLLEAVLDLPPDTSALPDALVFSQNSERLAVAWGTGVLQVWSVAGTPAVVGTSPNVPVTPIPLTPTAAPIGTGTVLEAAPLRSEPRTAPDTARELVCPADALEIIERRGDWLLVRVVGLAADCGSSHSAPGSEGWISVRFVARDP